MVVGETTIETEVAVIGGGPGGYAAAFRAADLGLEVTMIDTAPRPGGVCLFRGCIPSKALLYLTNVIYDAREAGEMGVTFEQPGIAVDEVRAWKDRIVDTLKTMEEGETLLVQSFEETSLQCALPIREIAFFGVILDVHSHHVELGG